LLFATIVEHRCLSVNRRGEDHILNRVPRLELWNQRECCCIMVELAPPASGTAGWGYGVLFDRDAVNMGGNNRNGQVEPVDMQIAEAGLFQIPGSFPVRPAPVEQPSPERPDGMLGR